MRFALAALVALGVSSAAVAEEAEWTPPEMVEGNIALTALEHPLLGGVLLVETGPGLPFSNQIHRALETHVSEADQIGRIRSYENLATSDLQENRLFSVSIMNRAAFKTTLIVSRTDSLRIVPANLDPEDTEAALLVLDFGGAQTPKIVMLALVYDDGDLRPLECYARRIVATIYTGDPSSHDLANCVNLSR